MMNRLRYVFVFLSVLLPGILCAQAPTIANAHAPNPAVVQRLETADKDLVVIQTNFGTMTMELFPIAAPKMVAHFKKLVSQGFYNGTKFHRVIPNFMIQGGDIMSKYPDKSKWGMGEPNEETVPAEFHPELHHAPGIVAAARKTDPNSASTQFYICVGTPSWLDGQYTIFGKLTDAASLQVAERISELKRDSGDRPLENVVMRRVYLKPAGGVAPAHPKATSSKPGAAKKEPK